MSFLDTLRKDKMQAMKDKDKVKVGVLSLMMSSIALAEKEAKRELTDEESLKYVQKEAKQTKDTLDMTPTSRPELIEEVTRKLKIIESYLPKQLMDEEILIALKEILTEKNLETNHKVRGILMKEMMAKFAGRTDGKSVNRVVEQLLK